ncbi:MAG: CU044_2847 family protein [Anaerolineales bacterium]
MAYREYILEDGTVLQIEIPSDEVSGGVVKASRGSDKTIGEKIGDAINLEKALEGAKRSIVSFQKAFEDAKADEVEIKFGLKATGELGNFAVAKTGVEANYEVTLKWVKKGTKESMPRRKHKIHSS